MNPCINGTLYEYFGKTDNTCFPFLGILHQRSNVICEQARIILQYRINQSVPLGNDRNLVLDFLTRVLNVFDVAFPPFFLVLLKESEETQTYTHHYRDHLLHTFYVFCLGCYVFDHSVFFRKFHKNSNEDCFRNWIVAAFFHDIGYCFAKSENPNEYGLKVKSIINCSRDIKASYEFWSHLILANPIDQSSTQDSFQSLFDNDRQFFIKVQSMPNDLFSKENNYYFSRFIGEANFIEDLLDFLTMEIMLPIDACYDIYERRKPQHGFQSSLLLIFLLKLKEWIITECKVRVRISEQEAKVSIANTRDGFLHGLLSIAFHDIQLICDKKVRINDIKSPIIPLLAITDNLQCWDREYYYFGEPSDEQRAPIPPTLVNIEEKDGVLFWKHDDTQDHIITKYAEYGSVIMDCSKFICKEDVESIIKDGNHE